MTFDEKPRTKDVDITEEWQKQCMVDPTIEFLNAGTLAPTLRCAFDASHRSLVAWMTNGPGGSLDVAEARSYLLMMDEQGKTKEVVAAWLGVPSSSIALLGNATDGVNAALSSLDWQAGDCVLTTDEEHEALLYPLTQLQRRFGVCIDVVPFPKRDEELPQFYEQIKSHLKPRTKLVALSSVSHRTGVHIDTTVLGNVLSERPETWFLVDGSHEAGASTERVQSRMDFYVFPGHKWLFGPVQTGVLWMSQRALRETSPLLSGSLMSNADGIRHQDLSGAWRFEYGTRDWSKMVGFREAILFRQQWSEATLVEQYAKLHEAFVEGFCAQSDIPLVGRAPVCSFETSQAAQIGNQLWERHRIVVKPQVGNIRVSLPLWLSVNRVRDLGRLIGTVTTQVSD